MPPPLPRFAPYATAASCIGQIDAGFANLDLRGTNFKVKLDLWYIYGINVAGWPGYEFADGGYGQYINLHAGGGCGFSGALNSTFYQEFPVGESPPTKRYIELDILLVPWPSDTPTSTQTAARRQGLR